VGVGAGAVEGVGGLRVAVTGASGLVGHWLVRALRDRGDEVVEVARGELPGEADLVFHLAAQTLVREARRDPLGTWRANADLTARVLAEATGRVVVASTDAVYGPAAPLPTPETAPLAPEEPYGASKAAADLMARTWPGDVVVARLSVVYGGADRRLTRLVPSMVTRALAGERPVIRGDGRAARDLIHVDDAVAGLLAVAGAGTPGGAYNVGTGEPRSVLDVARAVLRAAGSDVEPEILDAAPPGEGGRRALDTRKLRELTGWEPRVDLDEGLRRTVAWYREQSTVALRP